MLRKILVDVFSIEKTDKNDRVVFKCKTNAIIAELQPEVTLRAFEFLEVRQDIQRFGFFYSFNSFLDSFQQLFVSNGFQVSCEACLNVVLTGKCPE